MNTTIRSALAVVALVGCQGPEPVPFTPVDGREDLSRAVYHTAVLDSLSEQIVFEVPEGTGSLLIEAPGGRPRSVAWGEVISCRVGPVRAQV